MLSNASSRRSSNTTADTTGTPFSSSRARKGSAYMDYESTVLALKDAQDNLQRLQTKLKDTETEHTELRKQHSELSVNFANVLREAIDTSWRYCPEKSSDFKYTPLLDPNLLETEDRAGDYKLEHILGRGHYSLVRQCVDVSYKSNDPRARAKDASTSRKLFAASAYVSSFLYDKREERENEAQLAMKMKLQQISSAAAITAASFGSVVGQSRRSKASILRDNSPGGGANRESRDNANFDDKSLTGNSSRASSSFDFDSHGKNTRLAIKIMSKSNLTSIEATLRVEREIAALHVLSPHPNIVRFVKALHGPHNVYIITEGFRSDLFDFIEDMAPKLNSNIAAVVLRDILTALAHMAQHDIVHRDIKPENVLIQLRSNTLIVKLCDFGLSATVRKGSMCQQFCGSPGFFAPECVFTSEFDPYLADVFSCGCIALELLVPQVFFSVVWSGAYDSVKCGQQKQQQQHQQHGSLSTLKSVSKVASAAARWLGKAGTSKAGTPTTAQASASPGLARTKEFAGASTDGTPAAQTSEPHHDRDQDLSQDQEGVPTSTFATNGGYTRTRVEDFYTAIRASIIAAHIEICRRYSTDLPVHEFITRVLHIQPTLRPRATALLTLPWIARANKAKACDELNSHVPVQTIHTTNSLIFTSNVGTSTKISHRRLNEGNIYDATGASTGKIAYLPPGVVVPASRRAVKLPDEVNPALTPDLSSEPLGANGNGKLPTGSSYSSTAVQDLDASTSSSRSPTPSQLPLMASQQAQRTAYPRRMSTFSHVAFTAAAAATEDTHDSIESTAMAKAIPTAVTSPSQGDTSLAHTHPSLQIVTAQIEVKDNGLGILGISTTDHRKISNARRASFLQLSVVAPRRTSFLAALNINAQGEAAYSGLGGSIDRRISRSSSSAHAEMGDKAAELARLALSGEGEDQTVASAASISSSSSSSSSTLNNIPRRTSMLNNHANLAVNPYPSHNVHSHASNHNLGRGTATAAGTDAGAAQNESESDDDRDYD